ncbi:hypothetical protein ACODM8_07980 [Vibrio ostreicida]|uniref:Uncharacterized protein n=1 Tax=Vibrio ostreicida TaxID=526588 RepID=A0ABT8BQB1_9VIBR|nr:hypothetical protein [Vibrio ostreicida]MDN3608923.1 hypothetical protein [Vibrio ostreicida]NPD09957.1 hypothetical protein [Vibrio ostreicida]
MCIIKRLGYIVFLLFSFNAKSIDFSNSRVSFYEDTNRDGYTYPFLVDKDSGTLTYIDDLILDSLRRGKLVSSYYSVAGGTKTSCKNSTGQTITINDRTTISDLRIRTCAAKRTRLCLYGKDNTLMGGKCTDSYYGHTFYPFTNNKPDGYLYKSDGTYDGCVLNPVKIPLADIFGDLALFPETISTFVPYGTCKRHGEGITDYKSLTSALAWKYPNIYQRLAPKCTVTETKEISMALTNDVINASVVPTKVACK